MNNDTCDFIRFPHIFGDIDTKEGRKELKDLKGLRKLGDREVKKTEKWLILIPAS